MSHFTEFTPWLAGFLLPLFFPVHSRRPFLILPAALAIGIASAFAAGELSRGPGVAFMAIVIDTLGPLAAAVAARFLFRGTRRLADPVAEARGYETLKDATPTGARE